MTIQLVRKPPIGKKYESLRIVMEGNFGWDDKLCEFLQVISYLRYRQNIHNAGLINIYANLVDATGYPLTHFPDGSEISDHVLTIKGPYECAADQYRT